MGILHDDEEDLRAELAAVKADLQRLAAARNALEDAYNVAWGAGIETHLPICDVINKLLMDRGQLTKERDEATAELRRIRERDQLNVATVSPDWFETKGADEHAAVTWTLQGPLPLYATIRHTPGHYVMNWTVTYGMAGLPREPVASGSTQAMQGLHYAQVRAEAVMLAIHKKLYA